VKASTRGKSGARLPLMLLLGFVVLIAGVAVWLIVSSPDPVEVAETPVEKKTATAEQKPAQKSADKPATGPITAPAAKPDDKSAHDSPKGEKIPATHSDDAAHQRPIDKNTAKKPDPAAAKSPAQTATAPPEIAPKTAADTQSKPPAKPARKPAVTKPQESSAITRAGMPKKLPAVPRDPPLSPSPDPALVQMTALGPLPRVGDDGRLPRQVYAKPFNTADNRPRIAIVVTGLGLSAAATESAIQGLPGSVTLAFAPYSPRLNEWIRLARAAGHEVLINVPMEPTNYPAYDPGPQTLLTTLNAEGNLDRLLWSLSRGTGYVGVVDFLGSQFTTSRDHMTPVLNAIKRRGLLYLDSNSSPRSVSTVVAARLNLVSAKATLTLDERASRTEIDRRFAELEQRAKRERRAIGIASPYPVSLERIAIWVRQLEARGIAIAPVSALTQAPTPPKAAQ
jgi:polysaccharide deacetylase 2 family uncharacterized protein YibQ